MDEGRRWLLQPGSTFGRYEIVRPLGRGGMGEVYLVRNPRLERYEALKTLFPYLTSDYQMRRRFEREATLAANLDHPNIVSVYDADHDAELGISWISMKYIAGVDAARLLARANGTIAVDRVIDIIGQAAAGLDEAHRHHLLHRDVKPANILISGAWDGRAGSQHVCVSDFGIARTLTNSTALTAQGSFLGTLLYAAPETFQALETVDHRADVYSLGATLYELLTGLPPFGRSEPAGLMHAHLNCDVPRASALRSEIPPALDDAIATAMAKIPEDRFETCREFAGATARAAKLRRSPAARSGSDPAYVATRMSDERPLRTPKNEAPARANETSVLRADELSPIPPVSVPNTRPKVPRRDAPPEVRDVPESPPSRWARWVDWVLAKAWIILAATTLVVAIGVGLALWANWTSRPDDETDYEFAVMEQFLRDHYALLPSQIERSWENLSPKRQQETGGYNSYVDYWKGTLSTAVSNVTPKTPQSVKYQLDVIYLDRTVGTENRIAKFITAADGRLLIDEIEPIDHTMPNRPASTPAPR